MKVFEETGPAGDRVVALGTFDGVHRGHQALMEAGKRYALGHGILLRACSFDRHPLEVLRPEAFLQILRKTVRLKAVVAGWNYTFGKGGKGDAGLLQRDGEKNGYDVMIIPPVMTETGEIISSTLIRGRLLEGRIEEAGALMGHPYELRGRVTDGKHMGHRIGVPTANVQVHPKKQLPAFGVYPCRMRTEERTLPAVVNIGVQPTLPSGKVTVEAHVLDGEPELYGQDVTLELGNLIRSERKFESAEALTAQIRKDQAAARAWFGKK